MKIVLLPQAKEDLDRIADPLYSQVVKQMRVLKEFPELGAPMTGPFAGYRSLVVELFRIVYRILPSETIQIVYIRDCRRKPLV